jgi:hypothetical protein
MSKAYKSVICMIAKGVWNVGRLKKKVCWLDVEIDVEIAMKVWYGNWVKGVKGELVGLNMT